MDGVESRFAKGGEKQERCFDTGVRSFSSENVLRWDYATLGMESNKAAVRKADFQASGCADVSAS